MNSSLVYLVAMEKEIQGIFDLSLFTKSISFGFTVFTKQNSTETTPITIIQTGIGKSNAAAAAQFALQQYPDATFINLGAVGAFKHSLQLGEVVQVTSCAFFDVDVTALGFEIGQIPGTTLARYELSPSPRLSISTAKSLNTANLVTGDTFLSDETARSRVAAQFNPDIIDMELASIAHIFHLHQKLTQLHALKAVTDYADSTSPNQFVETLPVALKSLQIFCS